MRNFTHTNFPNKKSILTAFRINIFLLTTVLSLGLIYVFSINAMATTNFKIKKLSMDLADLEAQHKQLELENSTLQAISNIQQETMHLNFVPTTNVTYLKDDNVALR